jgi:hypothetical protein
MFLEVMSPSGGIFHDQSFADDIAIYLLVLS